MKRTMFIAAAAMSVICFASCQKEEMTAPEKEPLVFTATIEDSSTRTSITSDGKITWKQTDEITVSDGTHTAIFAIQGEIVDGRATFVKKSGEDLSSTGPFTADYGAAPSAAQTYSTSIPELPMHAETKFDKTFQFTVSCGLIRFDLTRSGESIKKISVTGIPADDTEAITYTLECENQAESIESAKSFYLALPAGNYTSFAFTNASGVTIIKKNHSGISLHANSIQPMALSTALDFAIEGKLNDHNWVKLYDGSPKWATVNVQDASGNELFLWGATNAIPKINPGSISVPDQFYDTATHLWQSGWRMPTAEEWTDLIKNTDGGVWKDNYNNTGTKGVVFTGKDAYESKSIFLPAEGYFFSDEVSFSETACCYWSSSSGKENPKAFSFNDTLEPSKISEVYGVTYGLNVRAVAD